ncbi:hypothetical protein FQN54_006502 [Arachnomyces sp. PD_36]|nr:hypothetical protein FQN54_006502 [Arachnomyces sp. PD_36]
MEATNSTDYSPIEDYGLIGDMHTCALVSKAGSIDFMCWPVFDSPSVFCRLLDKAKGGYFSISAHPGAKATSKQKYLPYTNILDTKWIHENGVADVLDYFPVSKSKNSPARDKKWLSGHCPCSGSEHSKPQLQNRHSALIRKIECVRGTMDMVVELFPAFDYAREQHWVIDVVDSPDRDISGPGSQRIMFRSETEQLHVEIHADRCGGEHGFPRMRFELQDRPGLKGQGLYAKVKMSVGQLVTFVVHSGDSGLPNKGVGSYLHELEEETFHFWTSWTRQCTFTGHYREQVERSLLALKLLTYKPTGAIIASPTFSLPETVGGSRNWDYRYSWIRDTSFVLYVFLKNGYSEEAEAFMGFIYDRVIPSISERSRKIKKGQLLPLVLTIRGEHKIPEIELNHLEGYRGSHPVRIGNGATSHTQLDIYGALLDSIYLYNKHAGPISYDQWLGVRRIVNHIIPLCNEPDMSIWEVRGEKQNFVFSKIMLWVTIDRALRLSEKRSNLPCPDRWNWLAARDELYEEIMEKGYNSEKGFFCMSYESRDVLDASVLIAPLVFFIAPDDPRFLSTLHHIMKAPEKGGLTSAKMVFRYDHKKAHDGIGGQEGAFIMVTFWLVEAMSRVRFFQHQMPQLSLATKSMQASRAQAHVKEHPALVELGKNAFTYFDNILSFANHLGIFSEEVGLSGEQIGNVPQAFSHLSCVSAAMNLAK